MRVAAAAGGATITAGILGDSDDRGATRLAAAYRRRHPGIEVRIRDTDLTDPTCGQPREGPVVRAVQECLQAVLWNGTVGMTPLGHEPAGGSPWYR
ncbi:MAG: hypothetical protein QOF10_6016 [Kribbellaceae bacterium]|nr:hypothetical protein [Kribbellaceae bacterium]